ncbi:MAG: IS630 family transposase [Desulfococcaceae bacterium]
MKPWQKKQWCIGGLNGEYLCRMEDVPDLYAEPYNPKQPVICFDEKPYQPTDHLIVPLPAQPGRARCIDYHYQRNGVCNILCAFEPATGKRIVSITEHRTRQDYANFMKTLTELYPGVEKIRLVQDRLNTHSGGSFYETYDAETAHSPADRFEYHYTPKKAGRLNMAEIELSALSKNCPDQRIASIEVLHNILGIRVQQRNDACAKINWQFSTSDARIRFKRFYKN